MQLYAETSCGVSSNSCAAKWEGAPTTAVHRVGRNPTRPSCRLRPFRRCGLGVEPFSDNIGQSVVDDDLDLEVQISSARTAPEPAREHTPLHSAWRLSGSFSRLLPHFIDGLHLDVHLRKARPDAAQQPFADPGRQHPPRRARQTPDAEAVSGPRIVRPSADCDTPSCAAVRPRTIKGSCCVTAKSDVSTLTYGCERSSLRPNLPPP
jgi:hypothetical protein